MHKWLNTLYDEYSYNINWQIVNTSYFTKLLLHIFLSHFLHWMHVRIKSYIMGTSHFCKMPLLTMLFCVKFALNWTFSSLWQFWEILPLRCNKVCSRPSYYYNLRHAICSIWKPVIYAWWLVACIASLGNFQAVSIECKFINFLPSVNNGTASLKICSDILYVT